MRIGPRVVTLDTRENTLWHRVIGGTRYEFVHVKVTRLSRPYVGVFRADTGELVRCTCPRTDCTPQGVQR